MALAPTRLFGCTAVLAMVGCSRDPAESTGAPTPPQKVAAAVPVAPPPPKPGNRAQAETQCQLAQRRFDQDQDYAAARIGYQQAIALDATFPWPHYQLGMLAHNEEQWAEAIGHFEQVCKLDPASPKLAEIQLLLDELKFLVAQDQTPEGKRSRHYEAAVSKARDAATHGRWEIVMEMATQAVRIDDQRLEAYGLQATALVNQQRFADAVPVLKRALDLAPVDKRAALQVALEHCEKQARGAVLAMEGAEAMEAKNYRLAQLKFTAAFALVPEQARWGLTAAIIPMMEGDYLECKTRLEKLLQARNPAMVEQAREWLVKVDQVLAERQAQRAAPGTRP